MKFFKNLIFPPIFAQILAIWVLWGLPGRPWEAHGPSRGALGAALGRPRGPWGGSRGALGAFRGRQNGTWTPLGRPGHPQGPSRMDFPWIFDGFLMESEQKTIRLAKGNLQRCHCHREPATMQRCWWHWPRAPRNWQRYLLQFKNCGDGGSGGDEPSDSATLLPLHSHLAECTRQGAALGRRQGASPERERGGDGERRATQSAGNAARGGQFSGALGAANAYRSHGEQREELARGTRDAASRK